MIIRNIRNLIAVVAGFTVIHVMLVSSSFIITKIIPNHLISSGNFMYNTYVGLQLFFNILASLIAGYTTTKLTAKGTTEWTFPVFSLTIIMGILSFGKILLYIIGVSGENSFPDWFPFVVFAIQTFLIPIGGFIARYTKPPQRKKNFSATGLQSITPIA